MGKNSLAITRQDDTAGACWLRYVPLAETGQLTLLFNEQALQEYHWLDGVANAGRGNTFFFTWPDRNSCNHSLVLRHYQRGGLISKFIRDRYWYRSLNSTRAFREFDVLVQLKTLALPAPQPFACRVERHGASYSASIITHRLPGKTLAEHLVVAPLSLQAWTNIGQSIADFHNAKLWHADLNAHNIMLDIQNGVHLIDFDRARFRTLPSHPTEQGWCYANIQRLQRSLDKLERMGNVNKLPMENSVSTAEGFEQLKIQWRESIIRRT